MASRIYAEKHKTQPVYPTMALLRTKNHTSKPSAKKTDATSSPIVESGVLAEIILSALYGIKSGSLEITVHDGRITYMERREKEKVNLVCPVGESDDFSPPLSVAIN